MKFSDFYLQLSVLLAEAGLITYPADLSSQKIPPYGLVSVLASGPGVNTQSMTGVVVIDIIVVGGKGPQEAHAFADALDERLVKKSVIGAQFFTSTLVPRGPWAKSPTLTRYEYSIGFKFFGR